MTKKQQLSDISYNTIFYAITALYLVTIASLFISLPQTLPVKWWTMPLFTLDYPLHLLGPIIAFSLGCLAVKEPDAAPRRFDGAVFMLGFWWLQLLLIGITSYMTLPSIANVLIPSGVPLIILGAYTIYNRKKSSSSVKPAALEKNYMAYFISIAVITALFQITLMTQALLRNEVTFNAETLSGNITALGTPLIFFALFGIGFYLFRRLNDFVVQTHLAIIVASLYSFSSFAWIYLFGPMAAETRLVITGNIFGIGVTLLVAFHLRQSLKKRS